MFCSGLNNTPMFQQGGDDVWRIAMRSQDGEVNLSEVAVVKEVVKLASYPVCIVTTDEDVWVIETAALPKELQG